MCSRQHARSCLIHALKRTWFKTRMKELPCTPCFVTHTARYPAQQGLEIGELVPLTKERAGEGRRHAPTFASSCAPHRLPVSGGCMRGMSGSGMRALGWGVFRVALRGKEMLVGRVPWSVGVCERCRGEFSRRLGDKDGLCLTSAGTCGSRKPRPLCAPGTMLARRLLGALRRRLGATLPRPSPESLRRARLAYLRDPAPSTPERGNELSCGRSPWKE
jgi:hypothetical protein